MTEALRIQQMIAEMNKETALINQGMYSTRGSWKGYGAEAKTKYQGPVKIISISDELESKPAKGFEDLASAYRTLQVVPAGKRVTKAWTVNIFENSVTPDFWNELETLYDGRDEDTQRLSEEVVYDDWTILDMISDVDFYIIDRKTGKKSTNADGEAVQINHRRLVLLDGDNVQSAIRTELYRLRNSFVDANSTPVENIDSSVDPKKVEGKDDKKN